MKLKTNNATPKSVNIKKNKSPKKQGKGVEVRKVKEVVKPEVLKKEAVKAKVDTPPSPHKIIQQELWRKAIENVSNASTLSDEESTITKLLADYKNKSSIPQRSTKFRNFIIKGFSKFKDTSDEVADGIYEKIFSEYKTLGGVPETKEKNLDDKKVVEKKSKNVAADDEEEMDAEGEEDGDDDDEDEEVEDIELSDDDIDNEEESEEEKPKPKAKGIKNGKSQPNKGNNGTKFKGGKVQKNKKFAKKK